MRLTRPIAGIILLILTVALLLAGCSTVQLTSGVIVSIQKGDDDRCRLLLENPSGNAIVIAVPAALCNTPLTGMRIQFWMSNGAIDSAKWVDAVDRLRIRSPP